MSATKVQHLCPVCFTPVPAAGYDRTQCRRQDQEYLDSLKRGVAAVTAERHHARGLVIAAEQREIQFNDELAKITSRLTAPIH